MWQVVSEFASGRAKSSSTRSRRRQQAAALALAPALAASGAAAFAADVLPTGGHVVAGQATIQTAGQTMTVNQSTNKAALDWTGFSIGQGHTVNFVQPSSASVALNRVLGADPSLIQGALKANGQVFLINPNGVLFAPTAQVDVGGLLASTLSMSKEDFIAGRYHLAGGSAKAVENLGSIAAANGGSVALVAAKVSNSGRIAASAGNVLLGAGSDVLVDFGGAVKLQVQKGALDALVENGGAIRADGGTVLLTAKSAGELSASVINNSGIVQARTLATGEKGQILLLGDMQTGTLHVGGRLDASAAQGDGGFIETSAAHVDTAAGLAVNAGAAQGASGQWLIDPYDYTINAAAAATIGGALNQGTSVTVTTQSSNPAYGGGAATGNGDITVASAIGKTAGGNATLTLRADRNIVVNSDITSTSGKLNLTLSSGNAAGATVGGVDVNANLLSNGGNILIGGGNGASAGGIAYALNLNGSSAAVVVEQGKAILSTGGNITINGRSKVGSSSGNYGGTTGGVYIKSNATIMSGTGNLLVNGESTGGSHTFGIAFEGNSNTVTTMGSSTGGGTMLLNAVNVTPGATQADLNDGAIGLVSYGNRDRIHFQGPSVANWLVYVNGAPQLSAYDQAPQLSSCATPYPNCGTMVVPGSNNSYLYATYQAVNMSTKPILMIQSGTGTKVYDGNTTATGLSYTILGAPAGFTATDLNPDPVFYTASKNAGSYTGLSPDAANPVNHTAGGTTYAVGYFSTGSYTITQKALTPSAADKVYDGTNTAAVTLGGAVAGDAVTASGSGSFAGKDVGSYAVSIGNITLGGADAANYTLSGNAASATASITPRTITLDASKTYDGSANFANLTAGNLVAGEDLSLGGAAANSANVASARYISALTLGDGLNGLASNYQLPSLAAASAANKATITPKALSIGGITVADKVYDGSVSASLSGGLLYGLVGNETLGLSTLVGSFADKNAGAGKSVTVSSISLSDGTGLASNYTFSQPSGLTGSIAPKALAVSGIMAADKVYDGSTAATVNAANAVFNGLVAGDAVTVSATGAFADANAGAGKTVALSSSYGGADAGNYTISGQAATAASILRKTLTVTGLGAASKTYDGTPSATLTGGLLSGLVGNETLNLGGLTGAFADKNAGIDKTVTVSGGLLTDGSGLASNYSLTLPASVTASITQKALTVSGITAADKVYDGSTSATVNAANAVFNGLVTGDTITVSATGAFADKNAGSNKAVALTSSIGGLDAANYAITGQTGATASITQKSLTVSGITAADKVYDGNTTATVNAANAVFNGLVAGDSVTVSASGAFADRNAGSGKSVALNTSIGGLDAANYAITASSGATASITPKTLGITGMTVQSKVYDGSTAATLSGGSLSGLVDGETLGFSGAAGSFADKNAGSGKSVTVTGVNLSDGTGLASNYSFSQPSGLTGSITPKALAVSGITAADKVYDGSTVATVNAANAVFNGLVAGDAVTVSATGAFADANAGAGKTVALSSSYGGLDAANYAITGPGAVTASITPKALSITGLGAASKTYDGTTSATLSGSSLSGLVAGETLNLGGLTGAFADKNAGADKTVTVSGGALSDGTGLAANYTLTLPASVTGSIGQKALTVSGITAADKVYDGSTSATVNAANAVFNGLVAGDAVTVSATGVFADKNAGSGKAVALSSSYGGLDAANYAITGQTGATASITPKALSVTGLAAASKTYDGTTVAPLTGGTLSGLVGDETLNLGGLTGAFADKNAGVDKTVTVKGGLLAAGTGLASNYTLTQPGSVLGSITQKALSVSGITVADKVYDGSTAASVSTAGAHFSGVVAGDSVSVSASGAFADKNAGSNKTVVLSSRVGGADAGNYAIATQGSATASITPKALTVSGITAADKVYDGGTNATVNAANAVLAGLVAGDAVSVSASGAFGDKNAGSGKTVSLASSYAGRDTGNYTITGQGSTTAAITPKTLTVSGAAVADKAADGSTGATLSAPGSLVGAIAGDSVALNGSAASAQFVQAAPGKGIAVNVSGLALSGPDAGNYAFSGATSTSGTIRPVATVPPVPAAPVTPPTAPSIAAAIAPPQNQGIVSVLQAPAMGGLSYLAVPEQGAAPAEGGESGVSATERRQSSTQAQGAGRDVKYLDVLVVSGGIRMPAAARDAGAQ